MDIALDLRTHCIVTEIRKVQKRAVTRMLKGDDTAETVLLVEGLGRLLEEVDLVAFRGAHRVLSGGTEAPVRLVLDGRIEGDALAGFAARILLEGGEDIRLFP